MGVFGFLSAGAIWVFAAPQHIAQLYVAHNTALLYFVLFPTTLLPQLFGFDPFTYTIAKQWQPEAVWSMPQFRIINLHITYMFCIIMFAAFLSNVLGQGMPFFEIVVPFILILGFGLPISRRYPKYYLGRYSLKHPIISGADFPDTVKELILNMPSRFNHETAGKTKAQIQFVISGHGGGNFFLTLDNGACSSHEGITGDPDLLIQSPGDVWMKISRGEIKAPQALLDGLYRVKGDTNLLVSLNQYFS